MSILSIRQGSHIKSIKSQFLYVVSFWHTQTCPKDQQRNKGVVDKVEVDSSVVRRGSLETESITFFVFPYNGPPQIPCYIYLPISRPKHEKQGEVVVDKQGGGSQLSCRQGSLEAASSPIDPAHRPTRVLRRPPQRLTYVAIRCDPERVVSQIVKLAYHVL